MSLSLIGTNAEGGDGGQLTDTPAQRTNVEQKYEHVNLLARAPKKGRKKSVAA